MAAGEETGGRNPEGAERLAVAVLAAGRSTRFGRTKQLLRLGGETLAARATRTALSAPAALVVVVLGHRAEEVRATLPADPRLAIVVNGAYARGQGSSLRTAAAAALQRLEGAALAVLLADMPFVRPEHVTAVWQALRKAREELALRQAREKADQGGAAATVPPAAARAVHGPTGRPGHPVVFAPTAVPGLLRLADDDDAPRAYLRSLPVLPVPFADEGVILDVDTEADLDRTPGAR